MRCIRYRYLDRNARESDLDVRNRRHGECVLPSDLRYDFNQSADWSIVLHVDETALLGFVVRPVDVVQTLHHIDSRRHAELNRVVALEKCPFVYHRCESQLSAVRSTTVRRGSEYNLFGGHRESRAFGGDRDIGRLRSRVDDDSVTFGERSVVVDEDLSVRASVSGVAGVGVVVAPARVLQVSASALVHEESKLASPIFYRSATRQRPSRRSLCWARVEFVRVPTQCFRPRGRSRVTMFVSDEGLLSSGSSESDGVSAGSAGRSGVPTLLALIGRTGGDVLEGSGAGVAVSLVELVEIELFGEHHFQLAVRAKNVDDAQFLIFKSDLLKTLRSGWLSQRTLRSVA